MKRYVALLLLVALSGLSACKLYPDTYLSVREHVQQPLPESDETQPEELPTVSSRSELRGAVLSFIRDWTERGVILVSDYEGDIAEDLSETVQYATKEDPIGAYAVDYADAELTGDAKSGSISLNIVFRRSAAEIDSIITVNGNDGAYARIHQALTSYDTALTLRIRNYEQTDFAAEIRNDCLSHPDEIAVLPELSAEVYPEEGETRILELHFLYPETREEMRVMQNSVNTILTSALSYIRSGKTDAERVLRLYRFLSGRFSYHIDTDEPRMPAYRLLCEGAAHSLSFATVFSYECNAAGIRCFFVEGTLNGQTRYWNLVQLDGAYYYIDLMRTLERQAAAPEALTAKELRDEGYDWDETPYPDTPEPSDAEGNRPVEPTEPSKPTNTSEPTKPSRPTEPSETSSTHSGTDSSSEESTEPTEPEHVVKP